MFPFYFSIYILLVIIKFNYYLLKSSINSAFLKVEYPAKFESLANCFNCATVNLL